MYTNVTFHHFPWAEINCSRLLRIRCNQVFHRRHVCAKKWQFVYLNMAGVELMLKSWWKMLSIHYNIPNVQRKYYTKIEFPLLLMHLIGIPQFIVQLQTDQKQKYFIVLPSVLWVSFRILFLSCYVKTKQTRPTIRLTINVLFSDWYHLHCR